MTLDFNLQANRISSEKNFDLAHHIWLEGFSIINDNAMLNTSFVNSYLENILKQFPKFTPLVSGSFFSNFQSQIVDDKLRSIHLPFDNNYHLEFWLETINYAEKLLYSDCSGSCKVLKPYTFPLVDIKSSTNFYDNSDIMDLINKGRFFYDPTIFIFNQSSEIIVKTYKAMNNFIKYSKKN